MIGTILGSYRVIEKLGEGGMGEVYLADDERLRRKVALKVLPAAVANDPDRRQRFEREIRAVSALNHPNILTLFDLGRDGDRYFMATEFIDGRTLREHLRTRGTFPLDEAIEIVVQCAEALDCAHAAGIVHRDIKPENIMIRHDGYVKVLDFGLATTPTPASPSDATETMRGIITSAGVVVGTMGYLSPEQARGLPIDARTDIFSLGVVFYEMVTGVQPFAGATPSDAIASILRSDPPPIDPAVVPASDRVNRIFAKALAKDRELRYATVVEFARDLQQLARDASDKPVAATRSPWRRIAAVAGILAAVVLGVVGVQQWRGRTDADRSETASPLYLRDLRTLAVLPFQLLGYPDGSDHVGIGMADALIVKLAMLRQLTVRPTTAVARYQTRDADVVGIGRSLQVDAVLTGNVQRDTGRTRVTVQLIRTGRNADATAVWSDTFTTNTSDPFEVQDALAAQLVQKLALQLNGQEQARLAARETTNSRARQLFIEGRYLLNKRTPADTTRAAELFDRAVSEDPAYARAHFSRAAALGSLMEMGALPQTTTLPRVREALDRALVLDPQFGEAYGLRSLLARVYDWNFDAAERDSTRAMELNPNDPSVLQWRGVHLLALGRGDEAVALHTRAVEIDPLDMVVRTQLCRALYLNKRYDRAIEAARAVIALDASQSAAHQWLGLSMVAQGRASEGLAPLQQAATLSKSIERIGTLAYGYAKAGEAAEARKLMASITESTPTGNAYLVAVVYAGLGDREQALASLERALQQRDGFLPNRVKLDPALDDLRKEPRFVRLLETMLSGAR